MREIMQNAIVADRKQAVFQNEWENILTDVITKYVKEISDVENYCQSSLDKIKKSVGLGSPSL